MAYSDWSIYLPNNGYAAQSAKAYGNDFPAPTGNSGYYCRELVESAEIYASGSQFINVSSEYAIRVQALVKGNIMLYINAGTINGYQHNGFTFRVGAYYWMSQVVMEGAQGNSVNVHSISDGTIQFPNTNWNSIRFTLYPINETQDRVIGEVEQGIGSGIWLKSFTGSNGMTATMDAVMNNQPGVAGRRVGVRAGGGTGYVDQLSVSLAALPVAIP
jgi:hypothetical protein